MSARFGFLHFRNVLSNYFAIRDRIGHDLEPKATDENISLLMFGGYD